jgi:Asp-tRNA(Asn)/Glu-tRNA(Gln) amidotransferase A subunit family amidase
MKRLLLIVLTFSSLILNAQTKTDSIQQVKQFAKEWYDLDFTTPEADSMLSTLVGMDFTYRNMHKTLAKNDIPYPFAFQPAPYGFKIPTAQKKVNWNLPANVSLPKDRNALAFYSLPQLASLIKNRKITSVELTRFFLERLKKYGDTLKCVITLTEDLAMKEARQADADLKKGIYHGLLHGIPYGLKDLFAVKGYRTTWGTTPYKDQVVNEDSYVYTKLKESGAVLCAKLSMGALAFNDLWFGGQTKNPWNLKQGSSGSSAGPASAEAAGLVPFTIGTETLGSIVSPSTRCGATGLRPTFGTISRSGAMVLSWSMDKAGPICRSAEDDAIVYYYLKGTDHKDAGSLDHPFNYNPAANVKSLKIAYAQNYFNKLPKMAIEWKVLDVYRSMGVQLVPVDFPDSAVYPFNMTGIILEAEASAAFDELTRTNRDDLIERQDKGFWPNSFRAARYIPAVEYINANRYRAILCQEVQKFMRKYDVVIVPTYAGSQLSITNLTGNPAVCMPMGFTPAGAPVSITLLGNLYDEASIVEAAKAYQDHTEWNKKHPALFLH